MFTHSISNPAMVPREDGMVPPMLFPLKFLFGKGKTVTNHIICKDYGVVTNITFLFHVRPRIVQYFIVKPTNMMLYVVRRLLDKTISMNNSHIL